MRANRSNIMKTLNISNLARATRIRALRLVSKLAIRRAIGKNQSFKTAGDMPEMACVGCWQEVNRKEFKCGCPDGTVGKWKHADDITPAEWGKIHRTNNVDRRCEPDANE